MASLSWVGRGALQIYFLVVLVYADIATTFHHTKTDVAFPPPPPLAMRPWCGLFRRLWAGGWAGGVPLIDQTCIVYSVIGFLCIRAAHRAGDPATALRHWRAESGAGCRAVHGEGSSRRRGASSQALTAAGGGYAAFKLASLRQCCAAALWW